MNKPHIIIGASAAAMGVINKLRQLQPESRIICISAESELPYNKCLLADYLAGLKPEAQVQIFTPQQQADKRVELRLNTRVTHIEPEKQQITLENGEILAYSSLFIGTGSSPFVPPIEGVGTLAGIFTFHTLADANAILAYAEQNQVKKAVIVGAGLSGLECADALHAKNIKVSLVEMQSQVLPTFIDPQAAELINQRLSSLQIPLYLKEKVISLSDLNGAVKGLNLASGLPLAADMLIFATGMRPNSHIAQKAGITCIQGAIATNEYLQTSHPAIFAGGDVAWVKNQVTQQFSLSCTWPDAMMQGMIAAHGMAGQPKVYPGVVLVLSSAFFGLKLATTGALAGLECQVSYEGGSYKNILINQGQVKGFTLLGPTIPEYPALKRALLTKQPLIF